MKAPKAWKPPNSRIIAYSRCFACDKFTPNNMRFFHDGSYWILCRMDYADYWENTDEFLSDYKGY